MPSMLKSKDGTSLYYKDWGTGSPIVDADATVPIGSSAEVASKLIPGAKLVAYEGEPHGLFYTARARLNEDLIRFSG